MEIAVRSGNVRQIETLIESGVVANKRLVTLSVELGYEDIALALLEAGVRTGIGRWTGLHFVCHEGLVTLVQALIDRGSRVNERDNFGQTPLMLADEGKHNAVSLCLLRAGASCEGLSEKQVNGLLRHACHEGDLLAIWTLIKNGCCSISILSKEDQVKVYCYAMKSEVQGCVFVAHTLLKNGFRFNSLSREEQEKLLHFACRGGDVLVVEALLETGCNINCISKEDTPLMDATVNGHQEIVKKLILAGANLEIQTARGYTALHLAASFNHILCGILLAEGGASVSTKNSLSHTPLDKASEEFKEAIEEAVSFTTRKSICIIGNAEAGKSTLIASLQAERNTLSGKLLNRFRRVDDHRQRTAGIETITHRSNRYGKVIFFDFAGQDDYHGPHQMFLESLLSKPGVSMTLLLVVKLTEDEEAILHQLHRWLSPVALMGTSTNPPQVIIVGSFLDKLKSKQDLQAIAKLTRCIETIKKDLEELPLKFVGSCVLNCRQPQSQGIDQICNFLQKIPIIEFRAAHTLYSLAWVLSRIRSSHLPQALQLQEFSTWVTENKGSLPQTMPPPNEVCQDLSAAGYALYLPNKKVPSKSWLVLDLPGILHDVYGILFSQSKGIVNEFGLLHCRQLYGLFPHFDLDMIQQLLISLEFCLPVDPSILKVELSKLTKSKVASGWLFFPALITAKPPHPTPECLPQQSLHNVCWQLRTARKHLISARVLQTILLRLTAHFVVKHELSEGAQHCCSIWWNGIEWQSKKGVDVTVHIINNRVIHVNSASIASAHDSCQYLTNVISDILSTVHQLSSKVMADCYIIHPPVTAVSYDDIIAPSPQVLFPVADIQGSIKGGEPFSLSLKDSNNYRPTRVAVSDLFGECTLSLEDIEKIIWPKPEPNQLKQIQPDHVLSETVYCEFILQITWLFCAIYTSL